MKCISLEQLKGMSYKEKCRVMIGIINKIYYLEGSDGKTKRH
jgi:hypothetical protein